LYEIEVIALGDVDPQHVVEQEGIAIAGREALVRTAGRAHHHLAELADLRVDAVLDLL